MDFKERPPKRMRVCSPEKPKRKRKPTVEDYIDHYGAGYKRHNSICSFIPLEDGELGDHEKKCVSYGYYTGCLNGLYR